MNRTARWLFTLTALLLTLAVGVPDGAADLIPSGAIVHTWNQVAFGAARAKNLSDARAARTYAMVNVAMYDAVNGIVSKLTLIDRQHAVVPPTGAPALGNTVAAAAAAAHTVLCGLFPPTPPNLCEFDDELQASLDPLGSGPRVTAGKNWGEHVGLEVLMARDGDGISGAPDESQPAVPVGQTPTGIFRTSWVSQPRFLAPFVVANPLVPDPAHPGQFIRTAYVNAGPPALTTLDYAAGFVEEKLLGNAAIPDADKLATFRFWNLGGNTNQPAGAWLQIGIAVSTDAQLHLADAARLFALMSMTMADTVAPTYQTKLQYNHWRPTTAIREAAADGNLNTDQDGAWTARGGGVGGTPQHWSGHSTFSASAGEVLRLFFCDDSIAFTFTADTTGTNPPNTPRMYSSFSAAVTDAGISRVYGGLHFNFSNLPAQGIGRAIADEVLGKALLLKHGPKHFGQCPL